MSRTYHHRTQPGWRRDERQAGREANERRRRIQNHLAYIEASQARDEEATEEPDTTSQVA